MLSPEDLQKVYAALAFCTFEIRKQGVIYLGTKAIFTIMTDPCVIGIDVLQSLKASLKQTLFFEVISSLIFNCNDIQLSSRNIDAMFSKIF